MKKKAVFLDRDGVISRNDPEYEKITYYITKWKDFIFLSHVFEGISAIKKKNYLAIIVTDQPGIGKGFITMKRAEEINKKMIQEFAKKGIVIDGIYMCPHKKEDNCECKKPSPKMLLQAAKDFDIDLKNSFIVGDKTTDIEAGKRAGVKSILVLTGYQGKDGRSQAKPDIVCKDLVEVAEAIP